MHGEPGYDTGLTRTTCLIIGPSTAGAATAQQLGALSVRPSGHYMASITLLVLVHAAPGRAPAARAGAHVTITFQHHPVARPGCGNTSVASHGECIPCGAWSGTPGAENSENCWLSTRPGKQWRARLLQPAAAVSRPGHSQPKPDYALDSISQVGSTQAHDPYPYMSR